MTTFRAISLWQPYASFVAWGMKCYETRSWKPSGLQRGEIIMIHAGKRGMKADELRLLKHPLVARAMDQRGVTVEQMPYGAIVGAARFTGVVSTNQFCPDDGSLERLLGNYQAERFAWELELVKRAEHPIRCNGQQGIFFWNGEGI